MIYPNTREVTKEQEDQWDQFRKFHHVGTSLTGTIAWSESPGFGISLGADVWFQAFMHRPLIPDYMRSLKVGDTITGVIVLYREKPHYGLLVSGLSIHNNLLKEWHGFKNINPIGSQLLARDVRLRGPSDHPLVELMNEKFKGYITNRTWPLTETEETNQDYRLIVTIVEFDDMLQLVRLNME